jgi:hypothetical protein
MFQNKLSAVLWTSILIMGLTACGSGSVQVSSSGAQLTGISVTPSNPAIATNTSQPFTAIGIYSDNTTQDLTNAVTWSSSDTTVATVSEPALSSAKSNNGKAYAYGRNAGTTTITATSGSTSGSTTLTVTAATLVSLTVTPANRSIAAGSTQQFIATGTFSDSTTQDLTAQVTWNSSNTGVSTISTSGLAAGAAGGTVTITATSGSISGTATLTVTAVTTTGSATLSWAAPATNTDGTALTDLAGYKIYYGTASSNYTTVINVGNMLSYTINNLASGHTYYFAVTAYDSTGLESGYSAEASKTL